ncbi:hypothetical protein EDM57_02740 [Brevibacillus gelatini]|uniref:DUF3800 domain-containing protein n=1 Tax=Brevibacillus gelatini TaxID=1655277 RepID=A0A3M8BBQ2_9BACL|nr:hypothetical protein EDM57_02740 [Brevibacillus gelatini]
MNDVALRIFFDESGKRNSKPNLMGGFSIPSDLYESDKFQTWTLLIIQSSFPALNSKTKSLTVI